MSPLDGKLRCARTLLAQLGAQVAADAIGEAIDKLAQKESEVQESEVTKPADSGRVGDRMSDELRHFIEGMSVSVDVSTSEGDAGNRYFGTVTEVMDNRGDKHGVTLLVQDAEPNFAIPSESRKRREAEIFHVPDDTLDRLIVGRATDGDQMLAYNAITVALAAQGQGQGEAVAKVRHFDYRGIARNGFSQEAQMLDGAPVLPDGTLLYTRLAPPASPAGVPDDLKPSPSNELLPEYRIGYSEGKYGQPEAWWPIWRDGYITNGAFPTKVHAILAAWQHAHRRLADGMEGVQRIVSRLAAPSASEGES